MKNSISSKWNTFVFSLLLVLFSSQSFASKKTTIATTAKEYANTTIDFFVIEDIITNTEKIILSVKVDSLGSFKESITLDNTVQIYCYLGIYKCTFYAEPGASYDLALPPRREIGLAEELNPYFSRELVKLGIKNSNDKELNYLISLFDIEYDSFITDNFYWLYITADTKLVDSIENAVETKFGMYNNPFLKTYIYYKLAGVRHFAYDRDMYYATKKYLLNKPFAVNNEAWSMFFNEMFKGFFTVNYADGLISELYEAVIYYKSPYRLKQLLDKKISFRNDTLKEFIILRGLYDAYSKPDIYPRQTVDQTLDSLIQTSTNEYVKTAGRNIFIKTEKAFIGDPSPNIKGITAEGDSIGIDDLKGKYLYIQFCRSENYACLKDYRLLKDLQTDLPSDELSIITLSYDQDNQTFIDFMNRNEQYAWEFIHTKDEQAIDYYDIKAMPTYILLDPDGNIAMNPAPSPHENFKYFFGMILRWRETAKKMQEEYKIPQD